MKTFGLRAVEYGNWVNDADAGKHLSHAYGALVDLAGLLGIEPKQLANQGSLALAFGARGNGNASAHYEPDRKVINLTHTRGGGSLAHEWAHSLDHALTEYGFTVDGAKRRGRFASHAEAQGLSHESKQAWQDVMHAINAPSEHTPPIGRSEIEKRRADLREMYPRMDRSLGAAESAEKFKRDSEAYNSAVSEFNSWATGHQLDQRNSKFLRDAEKMGDYWARPHELFARAFESWAESRLAAQKQQNTYLVTGTAKQYRWVKTDKHGATWTNLEPYPQGAERDRIHAAIDRLVETLKQTGDMRKGLEAGSALTIWDVLL